MKIGESSSRVSVAPPRPASPPTQDSQTATVDRVLISDQHSKSKIARPLKTVAATLTAGAASGAGWGALAMGTHGALVGGAIGAALGLFSGAVLSTPVALFTGKKPVEIPTPEPGSDVRLEPGPLGGLNSPLLQADFQKRLDSLTGSKLVKGNSVQILKNGAESFPLRYELMGKAQHSINIQTLLFHSDDAGLKTADILMERARAGVKCRVIFDALSSYDSDPKMFTAMRDAGVEVQAFNPVGDLQWHGQNAKENLDFITEQWKQFAKAADEGKASEFLPWLKETAKQNVKHWDKHNLLAWNRIKSNPPLLSQLNFRWHQKILSVDDQAAILGGLNIGSEYANGGTNNTDTTHGTSSKNKLRDTDVLVTGPVLGEVVKNFDKNWRIVTGKDYQPIAAPASQSLDADFQARFSGANGDTGVDARFIAHLPHEEHDKHIEDWLVEHLKNCKETAYIPNAYFIPNKRTVDAMIAARKEGVDVRVLTNSDDTKDTPVPVLTPAGRYWYRQLLEGGVRMFERVPGENVYHMHTKAAVFDSVAAEVGSNNMDNRSRNLNSEDVLALNGVKLGSKMNEIFRDDVRDSREITLATLGKETVLDRVEQFYYGRVLDYFL